MCHTSVAQQLVGLDCYNIGMVSLSRNLAVVSLGIPYQDGHPANIETHFEDDVILYRTTWTIDGRRVVGEWKLAGEFIPRSDQNSDAEYNLCLIFDSMKGTIKIGTELELLEPHVDTETLIRSFKSQMHDQSNWQ
jgi:hypothetical protein